MKIYQHTGGVNYNNDEKNNNPYPTELEAAAESSDS